MAQTTHPFSGDHWYIIYSNNGGIFTAIAFLSKICYITFLYSSVIWKCVYSDQLFPPSMNVWPTRLYHTHSHPGILCRDHSLHFCKLPSFLCLTLRNKGTDKQLRTSYTVLTAQRHERHEPGHYTIYHLTIVLGNIHKFYRAPRVRVPNIKIGHTLRPHSLKWYSFWNRTGTQHGLAAPPSLGSIYISGVRLALIINPVWIIYQVRHCI